MKHLFLLGLLLSSSLIFSQEKGELVKNNNTLVNITKYNTSVELTFIPVAYNRKDVELHEMQKISLTKDEYTRFIADLQSGLEHKKDLTSAYGDVSIKFDYENGGTIYSKTKLGTSFLNFKPKIRFGLEGSENLSFFLTEKDIDQLII